MKLIDRWMIRLRYLLGPDHWHVASFERKDEALAQAIEDYVGAKIEAAFRSHKQQQIGGE